MLIADFAADRRDGYPGVGLKEPRITDRDAAPRMMSGNTDHEKKQYNT